MSPRALALLAALLAPQASAQEFVTAKGKLSDEDFYRLVACAAPPGGECQKPMVRWRAKDAKDLTLGIMQVADGFPPRLQAQVEDGLDRAIDKLNAVGANLRIRHAKPSETPDIKVLFLDIPEGARITGTGIEFVDGSIIGAATMTVIWRANHTLSNCYISSSNNARLSEVYSVMLEELAQCMGLWTDIGGTYYESRSVFSETSNSRVSLGKQDLMALRRHYP
ncbi:hypothetical protein [Tabrizicola sp.]|uniref:hypothetical protein n=1 Tax=Tabrizicola sp. TaxID=2005166 RepID=UPI0035B0250D